MHTQAILTVTGSEAINIRWLDGGGQTFTAEKRSLIIWKIA